MLSCTNDVGDRCTVVGLVGELDASTVVGFREHLAHLPYDGVVVLDLSEVGFMDSSGLGAVIGCLRRVRQAGGSIALACPRPPLRRLLHTAGLDRIVAVADTLEDARNDACLAAEQAPATA